MSGAESWGAPVGPTRPAPVSNPYADPTRSAFWAPTVVNSCPECRHPTETHRLREIAVDRAGPREPRAPGRTVFEVECVVCQRQCCRAYG